MVAFTRFSPNRDVMVRDLDGDTTMPIAADPIHGERDPVWTPDGLELVFLSDASGSTEIWRVALNGDNPVQLSMNATSELNQQVAPVGGVLAFATNEFGATIWRPNVIGLDGSGALALADGLFGRDISWYPEGDRFALTTTLHELHVVPIDGTPPTMIDTGGTVDDAAVSPDGTRIAFSSDRDGPQRIYTCAPDGTDLVAWSEGPDDIQPTWSPSGTMLAFLRDTGPTLVPMLVGPAGEETMLDPLADAKPTFSWSPDGLFVAYPADTVNGDRIFIAATDGSGIVTRLTNDEAVNVNEAGPRWRP
jgi:Tol biopolymer transport system component